MNLRKAINESTSDFVKWVVLTQSPWDRVQTIHFLKRLGLEISPPTKKRTGLRFQVGDLVIIKKDKHKDPLTAGPYVEYNGKLGTVTDIDEHDVLVSLKSVGGPPVRFRDAQRKTGVGIFRYTPAFTMEGSPAVEIIYKRGGEAVSEEQKVIVDKYLEGGPNRVGYYYSGHIFNARLNEKGEVYFTVFSQQRIEWDPDSEASFLPRAFNPAKGEVLYMGILGKRPTGWEQNLEELNYLQ